jgi:hypothetical protein
MLKGEPRLAKGVHLPPTLITPSAQRVPLNSVGAIQEECRAVEQLSGDMTGSLYPKLKEVGKEPKVVN